MSIFISLSAIRNTLLAIAFALFLITAWLSFVAHNTLAATLHGYGVLAFLAAAMRVEHIIAQQEADARYEALWARLEAERQQR